MGGVNYAERQRAKAESEWIPLMSPVVKIKMTRLRALQIKRTKH